MQHDHAFVLSFSHVYFVIGHFLRLLSYRACHGDIISRTSLSRVLCIVFLYFIVLVIPRAYSCPRSILREWNCEKKIRENVLLSHRIVIG